MVYTPRRYLIPAALALVAQQAAASSLYYDPVTSANTTDEISSKFPARGAEVADQDCAITVEVDPTLPNITTISTVVVTYTELLANMTTAPTDALSTKVGTTILAEDTPATSADQDAYTTTSTTSTSTSTSQTSTSTMTNKTGTTVSQTSTSTTGSTTSTSTSTTSTTVSGSAVEDATTAPSTSSSVGGSSVEDATTSPKTGVTTTSTTSSNVDGSSVEDTTTSPKTGVTTTTSTTSSNVGGSSVEDTAAATTAPSTSSDVDGSSTQETTTSATKTGVTTATSAPTTSSDVDATSDEEPNCATGWESESRKLRHEPMSGRRLQEKLEKKRQLETNSNTDIAKLEAYFGSSMEMTLANLPTSGVHTPSPWPGPYWPTYQDSINVIWSSGEPSAAEKYATAFDLDVTDFMDKVSADNGIDSMSSHTVCSSDSDCSSLTDGSSCAIRADQSSGYCIPTWYGICHAWTPAAMLEDEPQCAVTYNGVTFQPMDLKALLSDIYDGATVSTVFTGTRYNGGTDSEDEYGRHSSDSYRDLNPAYFHIAAANLLGNLNATFIADVTAGSEVWNQPVRGFKVYEQTEMTLEEAASTFYGLEEYPWNSAAKSIVYVKTRLSWIFETYTDGPLVSSGKVDSYTTGAYYTYLLEMDDAGAIIGGEWVYDSDDDHPDFIWFPKAKPSADTVTSIGLSYADVTMLLEKSVACAGSSSGSESAGSASASASASASLGASTSGSAASFGASTSGSAASFGASTSGSAASFGASTSGSAASPSAASSLPGSAASGSAPFTTSTAASTTGSEGAATVAPVTEAPATETPSVTEQGTTGTSTTAPASTTATPATTTATPSTNQGGNNNQGDDSSDDQQQQQQQTWQSYFHWW